MRLVIADDSALWREGLARLLAEADVAVAALVGDADALEAAVAEHQPDLALIDIRMPPTWTYEGIEAAARIRAGWPQVGVVLLSQTLEARQASALVRDHPRGFGYLLKDSVLDISSFVDALATVNAGGTVLDPDVVTALVSRQGTYDRLAGLTGREREVLTLVAQGRSNSAIGRALFLTAKTVESHIASIMSKLDLMQEPDDHRRVLAVLAWLES